MSTDPAECGFRLIDPLSTGLPRKVLRDLRGSCYWHNVRDESPAIPVGEGVCTAKLVSQHDELGETARACHLQKQKLRSGYVDIISKVDKRTGDEWLAPDVARA